MDVSCPACTFLNPASTTACSICGTALSVAASAAPPAPAPAPAPSPAPAPAAASGSGAGPSSGPSASAAAETVGPTTSVPISGSSLRMVRYQVPADNTCLFRCIGLVTTGKLDKAQEMRELAARIARENRAVYSDAVLERPLEEYVKYIQRPEIWGGGRELAMFAQHFKLTFVAVNVIDCKPVVFAAEGARSRVFLLYSGIHYDLIGAKDGRRAGSDVDFKFPATAQRFYDAALALGTEVHDKGDFTDVANFTLRCNDCFKGVVGQEGAVAHAKETGHVNFGEFKK